MGNDTDTMAIDRTPLGQERWLTILNINIMINVFMQKNNNFVSTVSRLTIRFFPDEHSLSEDMNSAMKVCQVHQ